MNALPKQPAIPTPTTRQNPMPQPTLSVWNGIMITVGIVIGAGIFRTPAEVASIIGSPQWMMVLWIIGGALSLVGALTYAELASTYPSAGGDYHFLTRAYGRHASFFFAWARSTVIVTGSIALLGFVVGDYLTRILPLGAYSSALYAALATVMLTAMNLASLHSSARVQNWLTIAEVIGVLWVAAAAFMIGPAETPAAAASANHDVTTNALGLALVYILLTYGGWNEAAYVSAEIKGGARAIVRALTISIVIITAVYVLFVAAVWYGLGFEGLRHSPAVGATVIERAFGRTGESLISVVVTISALSSINATMISGARCNYALARDWSSLRFMCQWHEKRGTPAAGFLVQAAIALLLIAFGAFKADGFRTMVEFTAPVFWFFFMLTGIALFILRRQDAKTSRPFRVPFYPVLPLLFVATCAFLLYSSITYAQSQDAAWIAIAVVLGGALVWLFLCARDRARKNASDS